MSEFKGTPGPWFVRYSDDSRAMNMTTVGARKYEQHSDFTSEPDTVCIVFYQLHPTVSYDMDDLGDANAHLIAAAPDLLSELQESRKEFKSLYVTFQKMFINGTDEAENMDKAMQARIDAIDAVLSKALGKEASHV